MGWKKLRVAVAISDLGRDALRAPPPRLLADRNLPVGSSDASWPSKARHPVLNLRTFSLVWALFFASCVLEGYECQSSSNSSELPGHLDASLPARNTIYVQSRLFPT